MKNIITLLSVLVLTASTCVAQAFLVPTNPPAAVRLAWSPPPGTNIIVSYFVYWGTGSGQYTTKTNAGNNLTLSISNLTRGVTYYFAATSFDNTGLESSFSNEVAWRPSTPPGAPTMSPPVLLAVQKSSTPNGLYADAGMDWSLNASEAQQYFRLKITEQAMPPTTLEPKVLARPLAKPPSLPTK